VSSKRTRLRVSGEYSSGGTEDTEEDNETRPISGDRAKVAKRKEKAKGKEKGKESSSSSAVASKAFAMKNTCPGAHTGTRQLGDKSVRQFVSI
jgi:hypothetical protein